MAPSRLLLRESRCCAVLESNPAQQYFGGGPVKVDSCSQMDLVRGQAAAFLGARGGAAEIALMPSTTVSFNELAQGLVVSGFLGKGDRVLTSDQEHQGAIGCWQFYGVRCPVPCTVPKRTLTCRTPRRMGTSPPSTSRAWASSRWTARRCRCRRRPRLRSSRSSARP